MKPFLLFRTLLLIALGIICLMIHPLSPVAAGPDGLVGSRLPSFSVLSGDGKTCNLSTTKGKLTIIFYETRYSVKQNEPLKDLLKAFFREQPDEVRERVVRLPVIDCTASFYGVRGFWQRSLIEHSKIEGLTIYGDWDGSMKRDLGLKDGDTNFLVVDKSGIVRYHFTGKISEDSYGWIKAMLLDLVKASG